MTRPNCRRCGGPLDIERDVETQRHGWLCNNLQCRFTPLMSEAEFYEQWDALDADTKARLARELREN